MTVSLLTESRERGRESRRFETVQDAIAAGRRLRRPYDWWWVAETFAPRRGEGHSFRKVFDSRDEGAR